MDISELIANMLLGKAEGKDQDLLSADGIRQIIHTAQEELIQLGSHIFTEDGEPLYERVEDHITHEMLTLLDLRATETNYLLRAILTALTAGTPVDDLFPDDPRELVEQVPEPEAVPA